MNILAPAIPWGRHGRIFRAIFLIIAAVQLHADALRAQTTRRAPQGDESRHWHRRAGAVTIYRDEWGTPHIHGRTDADVVFGQAYALGEDRFSEIEPYLYRMLGRAAEVEGESALQGDFVIRALEIERLSREEYTDAPPRIREIAEAWSDGMNFFLTTNPGVRPRVLTRFEPWQVFAFHRFMALKTPGLSEGEIGKAAGASAAEGAGSNTWAVSARRSASGRPMLFIGPHTSLDRAYEAHLLSDEDWNVTGMVAYPFVALPLMGHNAGLGWALTVNYPDRVDLYEEVFDDPGRPLAYRYGSGYRMAVEWTDSVRVLTPGGRLETRILTLRKTHHGPILAVRNNRHIAVRMSGMERSRLLEQLYAMSRARNLSEFRRALDIQGLVFHNVMYADTAGNIFYIYNGLVPRRDPRYDWSGTVEGSDPGTEWYGYHSLREHPQLLNPETGWMQNANSTPFRVTSVGSPDSTAFPRYMVTEPDGARARASRRLLTSKERFTFEEWSRMAFDTYFLRAEERLPALVQEWNTLRSREPGRAEALREIIVRLQEWDRRGSVGSPEAAWFALWSEAMRDTGAVTAGGEPAIRALERVRDRLVAEHGTVDVPWGILNRLSPPGATDDASGADRESLPVPAAGGTLVGSIFDFRRAADCRSTRCHGDFGSSYVSVVEFGPVPRALTINPFGQSRDPASPHFFDQAPLYARGEFKRAWFTLGDVRRVARHAYHPGAPSLVTAKTATEGPQP